MVVSGGMSGFAMYAAYHWPVGRNQADDVVKMTQAERRTRENLRRDIEAERRHREDEYRQYEDED